MKIFLKLICSMMIMTSVFAEYDELCSNITDGCDSNNNGQLEVNSAASPWLCACYGLDAGGQQVCPPNIVFL